jgi:hypothetical protein
MKMRKVFTILKIPRKINESKAREQTALRKDSLIQMLTVKKWEFLGLQKSTSWKNLSINKNWSSQTNIYKLTRPGYSDLYEENTSVDSHNSLCLKWEMPFHQILMGIKGNNKIMILIYLKICTQTRG